MQFEDLKDYELVVGMKMFVVIYQEMVVENEDVSDCEDIEEFRLGDIFEVEVKFDFD